MKERPIIFSADSVQAILRGEKTQTRRILKPQPPSQERVMAQSGAMFGLLAVYADQTAPGIWRVTGPVWAVRELMPTGQTEWRSHWAPRDRLWVKEAFALSAKDPDTHEPDVKDEDDWDAPIYRTDGENQGGGWTRDGKPIPPPWRSPLFMPRWASRITLEVGDIRVQRVQDISEEDAKAEGVPNVREWLTSIAAEQPIIGTRKTFGDYPYTASFAVKWDEINGDRDGGAYLWSKNPWIWVMSFRPINARRDCEGT